MKIYMYKVGYDNKHFKPKCFALYNIEEVEMLNDFHTKLYYFSYRDGGGVCCGVWDLNGGAFVFCSLRKLTLNEIDKILNIYFKREHFMFEL